MYISRLSLATTRQDEAIQAACGERRTDEEATDQGNATVYLHKYLLQLALNWRETYRNSASNGAMLPILRCDVADLAHGSRGKSTGERKPDQ